MGEYTKTRFKSKRNEVWLCADSKSEFVKKIFASEECYLNEKRVYEKLNSQSKTLCPMLLGCDDKTRTLKIQFIDGMTLLEKLEQLEKDKDVDNANKLWIKLCNWLNSFHLALGKTVIMNDVNLRNFIVCKDKVYGVDFELSKAGNVEDDYIYAVAMYSQYNPVDSEFKRDVINGVHACYFKTLKYTLDEFNSKVSKQVEVIKKRRNTVAE